MASYNKVLLMGNLTKDPELRYTPQGTAVVNLRLAVNRKFRDRNQEMKEEVCFITAVAWDKQAEICNQYLHKGSPIFVEGRLQSRSWEDNSGNKRNVVEVRVERMQFLGAPPASRNVTELPVTEQMPVSSTETAWLGDEDNEARDDQNKEG